MDYTVTVSDAGFKASLSGDLSFADHGRFREVLEEINKSMENVVVLDIQQVSSIDSAGIGMLLIAAEQAGFRKQKFSVNRPTGQVERIIDLAALDKIIEITR